MTQSANTLPKTGHDLFTGIRPFTAWALSLASCWFARGEYPILCLMLIGLTGGIAGGKTTVAKMFMSLGAIVVDADEISREVVAPGTPGLAQLTERLGPDILNSSGELNRTALGAVIFKDADARLALEAILHPLIAQQSRKRLRQALAEEPPLVIYDAALLFETGRAEDFRPIIVVNCPTALQEERLMTRDGFNSKEAHQRIQAQMAASEKARLADYVIDNGGTLDETEAQVRRIWNELLEPGAHR